MRTRRLLAGVAVLGGAAFLAGSASTAGNTMPSDAGTAGYGSVTPTGVVITKIEYVVSATDGSKLDRVEFTTADPDATSMTGTLSIQDGGGSLVVASQSCGAGVGAGPYAFTCDPASDPAMTDVVTVAFTATRDGV